MLATEAVASKPPRLDDHWVARKWPELWKLFKFGVIGIVGAVPEVVAQMVLPYAYRAMGVTWLPQALHNLVAYMAEDRIGFSPAALVWGAVTANFIGQGIAFVLNRKTTFRANSNAALSTFWALVVAVLLILSNGVLIPACQSFVAWAFPSLEDGTVLLLGKMLSMPIPMIWVYPANRFIVHRVRKPKQENAMEEAD